MTDRIFTEIKKDTINYPVLMDVVKECGMAHNPRSFAIDIGHYIGKIAPFDEFVCFFLDNNGKITGQYLRGMSEEWSRKYLEYYSQIENKKYNYYDADVRENPSMPTINVHDWVLESKLYGPSEFFRNYIQARGLKTSCGFAFYDLHGNYRTVISLDRKTDKPFTNHELYNLQQAISMLNSLHKNFYYQGNSLANIKQKTWSDARLTAREIEVVDLLAQGTSPQNIARILYISISTTYKHIAHIYEKMHVSSQQELLVKILRAQEEME